MTQQLAPGLRVEVRDAEWRIKRIDHTTDGGQVLACEGLSELVRGRESLFLTKLEQSIRVLAPETTQLVDDVSSGYRASLLYLDTLLRKTPPTDDKIHVAQHAAIDQLPYHPRPAPGARPTPHFLAARSRARGCGACGSPWLAAIHPVAKQPEGRHTIHRVYNCQARGFQCRPQRS